MARKEKLQKKMFMSKNAIRFMISFFLVLLLPVLCFIFLFQRNFREVFREKLIQQIEINLEYAGMELDRRLEGLRTEVDYNARTDEMQEAVYLGDRIGREMIQEELQSVFVSHIFLSNVYYYDETRPDTVYSTQGCYTLYYYAKLRFGMEDPQLLLDQLHSIKRAGWSVWKEDLYYIVKDGTDTWWMFSFDDYELESLIGVDQTINRLLDYDGSELYVMPGTEEKDYREFAFTSSIGDFQLVRQIEEAQMFAELDVWQTYFMITVIFVMLVGGILIFVLTWFNELPFRKMLALSREKIQDIPKGMDLLEVFQYTLNNVEKQANLKINRQEENLLMMKLIYGQDCDSENFRLDMKKAGLFSNAQCFRVVLVKAAEKQEMDFSKIHLYLHMQEKEQYEFRLTELSREDAAVMIVGMTGDAEQNLERELLRMADNIRENFNERICFFVGGKCNTTGEIHSSYVQAYISEKNKNENDTETVVFYQVEKKRGGNYLYPKKELNALFEALVAVELDKAAEITDVLVTKLQEQRDNRFISVALYYDIVNAYFRALSRMEKDYEIDLPESELLRTDVNADAIRLINSIRKQYQSYVEEKNCAASKKHREEKEAGGTESEKRISKVLAFIGENTKSNELSVSMVADRFDMSISHLSHDFKRVAGCNISDYIVEKKLSYACELLIHTELSMTDIAFMTGYSHPVSFRRKFKQQYGVTPGEYRMKKEGKQ